MWRGFDSKWYGCVDFKNVPVLIFQPYSNAAFLKKKGFRLFSTPGGVETSPLHSWGGWSAISWSMWIFDLTHFAFQNEHWSGNLKKNVKKKKCLITFLIFSAYSICLNGCLYIKYKMSRHSYLSFTTSSLLSRLQDFFFSFGSHIV